MKQSRWWHAKQVWKPHSLIMSMVCYVLLYCVLNSHTQTYLWLLIWEILKLFIYYHNTDVPIKIWFDLFPLLNGRMYERDSGITLSEILDILKKKTTKK